MPLLLLSRWMNRFLAETKADSRKGTRLNLESLEDRSVPSATDLGVANDFNAFVFHDFNAQYSDLQGRLAVGGNAGLTGYGIGTQLTPSHGTRDDAIVGGNLNFKWGQVYAGNLVYGGIANLQGVGLLSGSARQQANVIDFNAAETDLQAKSLMWSAFIPNGTVTKQWGSLRLVGTDPDINVFALSASDLNPCYGMTFNVPTTSTVVINVSGTTNQLQNFWMNLNGLDKSHVLFNFFETQKLTVQGIGVEGSVLAPFADVNFTNANIDGTFVADSLHGSGQFHNVPNHLRVVPPPVVNSSLGGSVFELRERFQLSLSQVQLILQGIDDLGQHVNRQTFTDEFGNYFFDTLRAGTYSIQVVPPTNLFPSRQYIGSLGGSQSSGLIFGIVVNINDNGSGYNFGLTRLL